MLNIQPPTGAGDRDAADIHNKWDTIQWVTAELSNMGVRTPAPPAFECPRIEPGDLNSINTRLYSEKYGELLAWYGFVGEQAAYAKAIIRQYENEMTYIESSTKKAMRMPGKKTTAEDMKIAIETNPRYVELMLESQRWRQMSDLLSGRLETIDASMKAVSRNVEIRKLEQGGGRVHGNMPGRNRIPVTSDYRGRHNDPDD